MYYLTKEGEGGEEREEWMEEGYKSTGEEVKMMEGVLETARKHEGRRGSEGWGINGVRELEEGEQENDETVEK